MIRNVQDPHVTPAGHPLRRGRPVSPYRGSRRRHRRRDALNGWEQRPAPPAQRAPEREGATRAMGRLVCADAMPPSMRGALAGRARRSPTLRRCPRCRVHVVADGRCVLSRGRVESLAAVGPLVSRRRNFRTGGPSERLRR